MWITEDGRTHSAAFDPWMVAEGRKMILRARRLDADSLEKCRDQIERLFVEIDDQVNKELAYSEDEANWEAKWVPDEYLEFLDQRVEYSPASIKEAVSELPARWQQDGVYFLESVFDEAAESWWRHVRTKLRWMVRSLRPS
ncbi:hypothetical protein CLV49_2508 [Labedella gwakjiensis]|uniref:Uncharacterized protein n=1 Tax=Labedella gwakjiensis TaxID=390269 RepID=A0A2P8GY32_9MICO|nr:hypothetical protein [Labedella gwakjiensis]PSL38878.1 hypothetical protein CLV49_2508 [Labedella gwakjiensis]RUQ86655.1 hypothetical protein ELQ93_06685 [Labedella gwakjiensis]